MEKGANAMALAVMRAVIRESITHRQRYSRYTSQQQQEQKSWQVIYLQSIRCIHILKGID